MLVEKVFFFQKIESITRERIELNVSYKMNGRLAISDNVSGERQEK